MPLYYSIRNLIFLGPFGSGKTTLISAWSDKLFSLKIEPTKEIYKIDLSDISLIDTPGFDGPYWKEEKIVEVINHSDGIMWVHSIERGGMENKEMEFIARMKAQNPSKPLWIVISKIDRCFQKREVEKVIESVKKEIENFINTVVFSVSAQRYLSFYNYVHHAHFMGKVITLSPFLNPLYRKSNIAYLKKKKWLSDMEKNFPQSA